MTNQPSFFDADDSPEDFAAAESNDDASGVHGVVRVDALQVECDGGSRGNPGPAAIGAVVRQLVDGTPGDVIATVSERIGIATNNVAEYRALVAGLEAAVPFEAQRIRVQADSELLIRQLEGRYRVKNAGLQPLHARASSLLQAYDHVELVHVLRAYNTAADSLVNAALDAPDAAAASDTQRG